MVALIALMMVVLLAGKAVAAPYAAVVMDARSGEILHARNHDTRLHPASLTKMMTLYVAFEAIGNGEISLDTMVTVSRRAASEPPSRLGLRAGQRIALRYLIRAAALRSGNDAATAIAEAVSGSVEAFTARMNATAAAIGMNNTRFLNAHGLTQVGHYSSARDMTLLGRQLYFDYPQYYNLFSRRSEDAGVARVRNTNTRFLDGYRGADGIKTGYTRAAGFNLTASAERNGVRIIVTVFGGRSVADRHQRIVPLMDMGFERAPARVAVQRPARPQYAEATGSSRSAGRVVRLRTAPSRSLFPAPRPAGETELPADDTLLAGRRDEIDAVVAEAAIESVTHDESDLVAAPDASPLPRPRPGDDTTHPAETVVATRSAGSPTEEPPGPLGEGVENALALAAVGEIAEPGRDDAADTRAAVDKERDAIRQQVGEALSQVILPDDQRAALPAPLETLPLAPPAPQRFDHGTADLGPVIVRDGLVVVPGLPPIAVDEAVLSGATAAEKPASQLDQGMQAQLEFLQARVRSDRVAVVPQTIVLTASDAEPAPVTRESDPATRMVVRREAPSAGGWTVRLGDFPSRFDAERTLLRVVLSENATLGMGERKVNQRAGRFVADIAGLTREQAQRACGRLAARARDCSVIEP